MKPKVQAQRKFAQGALVPTPAVERRTADPAASDNGPSTSAEVHLISHNTSAKNILDSIAFSYPGMHSHIPRVVLHKLETNCCPAVQRNTKKPDNTIKNESSNKKTLPKYQLRPRRQASLDNKSDDDRPLTYHINKLKTNHLKNNESETTSTVTRKRKPAIQRRKKSAVSRRVQKRKKTQISADDDSKDNKATHRNCPESVKDALPDALEDPVAQKTNSDQIDLADDDSEDDKATHRNCPESVKYALPDASQEPVAQKTNSDQIDLADDEESFTLRYSSSDTDEDTLELSVDAAMLDSTMPDRSTEEPVAGCSHARSRSEDFALDDIAKPCARPCPENNSPSKLKLTDQELKEANLDIVKDPVFLLNTNNLYTNISATALQPTPAPPVITDAPVYYPTEEEFSDPLEFYKKILATASMFGLCKVVAPANFKPTCYLDGLEQVMISRQYPARFFKRWGDGTRDLCAIRAYLYSHSVVFSRPPLIDGLEVNLPKLFRIVQKYGGFNAVTTNKTWTKVAEEMNFTTLAKPEKILDQIYVKYVLPYDIMSDAERKDFLNKVKKRWRCAQAKLHRHANNPLHMQKVFFAESDESTEEESEQSEDEANLRRTVLEEEECVKAGRQMKLLAFRKANDAATHLFFPTGEPTCEDIERAYWEIVEQATEHVSVNTASIDTSETGYGFTTDPEDPMSTHPWNLKNIRKNNGNVLQYLGPVVSTTVPILHLGMIFATHCWHRDPHGLPWLEYLHLDSKPKIWYGIPNQASEQFRQAVMRLCPTSVQNKKIWLPSDIAMIPPNLLLKEGLPLTKTVQNPGEYILILPQSYSSSICTGYSISESVYFAVQPWLSTLRRVCQDLRADCEPMSFAPEQLLISMARDERVPLSLLQQTFSHLNGVVDEELSNRFLLLDQGVPEIYVGPGGNTPWNIQDAESECDVCRQPLYVSKVQVKQFHKNAMVVCTHDALSILAGLLRRPKPTELVLETILSDAELKEIVKTVQNKLSRQDKKIII